MNMFDKISWISEIIRSSLGVIILLVGTILLIDINIIGAITCGIGTMILLWWLGYVVGVGYIEEDEDEDNK